MSDPGSQSQPDEALVDLLVKQVTEGLSPAEQRALDAMEGAASAGKLQSDLERAAAAISISAPVQALPLGLKARLDEQARTHAASLVNVKAVPMSATATSTAAATSTVLAPPAPRRASRSGNLGWFAAAACLVLAVFGWLRSPPAEAPVAQIPEPPPAVAPPQPAPKEEPPTPAQERDALLANTDSLKITLGATKDPAAAGVTGDVVWDPVTQKGFLHFVGLAANDPSHHQYQIWIFDGARDKRYPVDGGVFDVPANAGDVVIPIRAALLVHKPAAFAVTVEKPGGSVVSARDHVVALGATT